jgi:anti-sigma-K factor RskA
MSTDLHILSGAYALDAVTPAEAEQFRAHLSTCDDCRREVRELRKTAATLADSVAMAPPPQLRAKILAAAANEPQPIPIQRARPARPEQRSTAKWLPRLVAAAAVVVIGGIGIGVVSQDQDQDPGRPLAAEVVQVFEAPDARSASAPTDNGGTVEVATSPGRGEMAVDTHALPALEEDKVYQLWATRGPNGPMESVAVLDDPTTGAAMPMPEPGVQVAITIEPAGGSEEPTDDPIVTVTPSDV